MSEYVTRRLGDIVELLDNKRVPLNEEQRSTMFGNIPYYGANGVQGYINKALFDEPLILMAEDGGYFDEFVERPIAYKIDGPAWVNNHAHVLKATSAIHQDFLFYALQHKDIRQFIKGGTRAKLNAGDLKDILIKIPVSMEEQAGIAEVLSALDEQIEATVACIQKKKLAKVGLSDFLLSGGNLETQPLSHYIAGLESGVSVNADDRVKQGNEGGVLKTSCVLGGKFIPSEHKAIWTRDMARAKLNPAAGSIIVSRMNTPELVGESGYVENDDSELFLPDRLWQTVKNYAVQSDFRWLSQVLQWGPVRKAIKDQAMGTSNSMKNISKGAFLSTPIPAVPFERQVVAAEILGAADSEIEQLTQEVEKLRLQKQGLMRDLLTGAVRLTGVN